MNVEFYSLSKSFYFIILCYIEQKIYLFLWRPAISRFNHSGRAMLWKVQQRFIFNFNLNIAALTGPAPHVFLKATLLYLHLHRREPTPLCQCVISCDALDILECCTLCSAPVLMQYFGKWWNLYDIFFLHILLMHYMSSSVCVMANWLWSEDLLWAFKEISSDEETTTDKDESDTNPSVECGCGQCWSW